MNKTIMKFFIQTFGCQMNYSDSEKIAATLKEAGHRPANSQKAADLIVLNACSVRQSAVDRIYGQLANLTTKKIIVAGCLLPEDKKRFQQKGAAIWQPNEYFCQRALPANKKIALVPIMTGCNNFCSYCVVPFTRGREKSRPAAEIINEIKKIIKNGAQEILLLGQNVNSYKDGVINFPRLLTKIDSLPGNFWLTFLTSHPKDMSDELIMAAAKSKKVLPHIHLPAQSGDDKILKRMNRRYTAAHYRTLVKKIRRAFKKYRPAFPPVAITTDIIVGFPGETKKQFKNTAALMRRVKFDMAYLAQYSPRIGTSAARLTDSVPPAEKKRREEVLNNILAKTALAQNKKYIGRETTVFIKETRKNTVLGKTITDKTVKLTDLTCQPGDLINAKIIGATSWGLKGQLIEPSFSKKIIAVVGQTSSGKSDLAVKLAKRFDGEIISADSRQVYKNMNLGTGKITKKEMAGIPHYLLDVASPRTRFTAAQYKKLAQIAIKKTKSKNKIPIICGGSGFYLRALLDDLNIPAVKPNFKLRARLEKKSTLQLFAELKKLDPRRAKSIDRFNRRRLIRAIEIIKATGQVVPKIELKPNQNVLFIGIKKSPKILARLIKTRLKKRLRQGLIKEVQKLRQHGLSWKKLDSFGLEYRWVASYLQNKIAYQEMIFRLQKDIEHFAKRQMTWFRLDKRIHWIRNEKEAARLTENFLKK